MLVGVVMGAYTLGSDLIVNGDFLQPSFVGLNNDFGTTISGWEGFPSLMLINTTQGCIDTGGAYCYTSWEIGGFLLCNTGSQYQMLNQTVNVVEVAEY